MENQIALLQKQVKQLRLAIALIVIMALAMVIFSFTTKKDDIIITKGIIVEDASGKPFIMMGNPLPKHRARKREDALSGLVFVDSKGVDRLYLGKDGKLQMGGELVERNAEGWSLVINDPSGDERGGFGFADDDDRIGLGLDYGGKEGLEAIYLSATPEQAYITINGDVKQGVRDRIVLWHDTTTDLSQIKIGDKTSDARLLLRANKGKASFSVAGKEGRKELITPY
jgi:hypothetical protein